MKRSIPPLRPTPSSKKNSRNEVPFASRIIFMGTPEFAVPSLKILLENNYPVVCVVTAPDKPRGRGQELTPTAVKEFSLTQHLSVLQPVTMKDPAFALGIKSLVPDLIVVVAFRILPKEVFTLPRFGSFNLHASLLPRYRGAAPINWAVINGDRETGVTSFFLQEKVDTGNTILQARIPIRDDDDAGTLHDRLAEVGAEIVLHTVRLIESGRAMPKPQDDSLASPAPKIFKEDCQLNWNLPAVQIHNRIRGLSPHPAAFTMNHGKVLKLFKSRLTGVPATGKPGEVVATKTTLHITTNDTLIEIVELQQEGRKRMSVEEFLRGYRITTGEVCE